MLPEEKIAEPFLRNFGYTPSHVSLNLIKLDKPPEHDSFYGVSSALVRSPRTQYDYEYSFDEIHFVFGLEIFDENSFKIANGLSFGYGDFDHTKDFESSMDSAKLAQFIDQNKEGLGEIMMGELAASFLKAIWVHPARREELVAAVKSAGLLEINGRFVEELILSPVAKNMYLQNAETNKWTVVSTNSNLFEIIRDQLGQILLIRYKDARGFHHDLFVLDGLSGKRSRTYVLSDRNFQTLKTTMADRIQFFSLLRKTSHSDQEILNVLKKLNLNGPEQLLN